MAYYTTTHVEVEGTVMDTEAPILMGPAVIALFVEAIE
jgi:hypothetical protein